MFNFKRREIRIEFNDPTPLCVGFLFLVLVYLFFSNPYHQTVLFVLCLGALAYLIVSKKHLMVLSVIYCLWYQIKCVDPNHKPFYVSSYPGLFFDPTLHYVRS